MKPVIYLIDHENIRSPIFSNATKDDIIYIFYTVNAAVISLDSFRDLKARIVVHRVPAGKQSLDMHLACYLGYLVGTYGSEYQYTIISHDNDYLKVMDYLRDTSNVEIRLESSVSLECENKIRDLHDHSCVPRITSQKSVCKKTDTMAKENLNVLLLRALVKHASNVDAGRTTSSILQHYGEKDFKLKTYRCLIQKFGQNQGLLLYNELKPNLM